MFIDLAKEEKWLNQMADNGYYLIAKDWLGRYEFNNSQPQSKNIRIDYRLFKTKADFLDYRTLFEDSGWQHIAGTKSSGAQYFAGPAGGEEIFSDNTSKAGRYMRLSQVWLSLAIAMMPLIVALFSSSTIDTKALLNPRLLYYTPGLWDKAGDEFWQAFLFETPFALMRGFAWLALPALTGLYLYFSFKSQRMYRQSMKSE